MSKYLEEFRVMLAESSAKFARDMAESRAEFDRRLAESRTADERRQAEYEKYLVESRASMDELKKQVKATNETVNGIGRSNGMVAEEYFYESLCRSKTFGGVHYDDVKPNIHSFKDLPDKTRLEGEYDIVMLNDESVCLIETKYRVRSGDVRDLVGRQVVNFKLLFPDFAGYKYYLGIGGMCFEEDVEAEAKRLGIGVLRLNGDAVEISDENLKVY